MFKLIKGYYDDDSEFLRKRWVFISTCNPARPCAIAIEVSKDGIVEITTVTAMHEADV